MAILTRDQLLRMGFKSVGENVNISDKASFYRTDKIIIGDNVRIDDFSVLSAGQGGIEIGSYIHIAVYCSLIGAAKITLKDYSNLSSKVAIYSSSDDYSGEYMTNPMVPEEFTNVHHGDVSIGKHVVLGCGAVVLPGVTIGDGAAIGALSLVNKSCFGFFVYAGVPVKIIKPRSKNLISLEHKLVN